MGGSVANNDPAADYPAGVLGLNATVNTNKRSIPADEFFVDMFETALEEGELLMGFSIPRVQNASYQKFANPASRYAMVGVMVAVVDGAVREAAPPQEKVREGDRVHLERGMLLGLVVISGEEGGVLGDGHLASARPELVEARGGAVLRVEAVRGVQHPEKRLHSRLAARKS